jgi:hypothetical protein
MTCTKRRTSGWNKFQGNNFKAVQEELGNCLHLKYLVLTFPESQSPQGVRVSRKEIVGVLGKRWKQQRDKNALDTSAEGSMTSTRSTTPTPASTPIGDLIIPPESETWKKERKRLWSTIKQSVRIPYTAHTYCKADMLHARHAASLFIVFVPKEDPIKSMVVHYTGEEDESNPAFDYHCALAHSGSMLVASLTFRCQSRIAGDACSS